MRVRQRSEAPLHVCCILIRLDAMAGTLIFSSLVSLVQELQSSKANLFSLKIEFDNLKIKASKSEELHRLVRPEASFYVTQSRFFVCQQCCNIWKNHSKAHLESRRVVPTFRRCCS